MQSLDRKKENVLNIAGKSHLQTMTDSDMGKVGEYTLNTWGDASTYGRLLTSCAFIIICFVKFYVKIHNT